MADFENFVPFHGKAVYSDMDDAARWAWSKNFNPADPLANLAPYMLARLIQTEQPGVGRAQFELVWWFKLKGAGPLDPGPAPPFRRLVAELVSLCRTCRTNVVESTKDLLSGRPPR